MSDTEITTAPEDKKNDDSLTVHEAADERAKPVEAVLVRSLDLPESLSMSEAGEAISESRRVDAAAKEVEKADKLTREIDEKRGEPEEAPKAEKVDKAAPPPDSDEHVEKLIRKHPKIAEKILQHAQETEAVRAQFKDATDASHVLGRAVFHEAFPEFANLPVTHDAWNNELAAMRQRDPARFQAATKMLNSVGAIEQMQAQSKAHDEAEFKRYVASENQKFAERHRGEKLDPAAVMETLKSVGVDPAVFLKEYDGSRFLRSAEAQAIMVKAAKYDALMKRQEAARNAPKPKAAPRPVPTVVRPGSSQPRVSSNVADLRTAMGRLEQSGSMADAVRALNISRRKN